jgi:hypothetical protein
VKRSIVVAALGTAQTLAWASSYYLPAILADPICATSTCGIIASQFKRDQIVAYRRAQP